MFCCILKGKYYASNKSQNQVSKFCQLVGHGPTYPGLVVCKDLVNARTRRKCWIVFVCRNTKAVCFYSCCLWRIGSQNGGRLGNLFLLNGHKLYQLDMDMPASWDWSRIEKGEQ